VVIHAALLFLLFFYLERQAAGIVEGEELTEIAYIETHYGEDVAAKVRLKRLPAITPRSGTGVTTDSMLKPPSSRPEPPRPDPRAAMKDIDSPELKAKQIQPQVVEAPQLESKQFRSIDTPDLASSRVQVDRGALDASLTPKTAPLQSADSFQPSGGALQSRSSKLVLNDGPVAKSGAGDRSANIAEPSQLGGGGLQSGSRGSYQPSAPSLSDQSSRSGGTQAVLDAEGPSGSGGGSTSSGRKTILDYGSGSGRGGALNAGRGRLVEAPGTDKIVKDASPQNEPRDQVAEAEVSGQGVSMTISGQIKGRKILSSSPPAYTDRARKEGWEGVVAVHFTVLPDGRVKDNVYFEQTSAHRDLNKAATDAIRKFRFAPLPADQAAVEQWGVITIVFRLN
jgi:TonB family protein